MNTCKNICEQLAEKDDYKPRFPSVDGFLRFTSNDVKKNRAKCRKCNKKFSIDKYGYICPCCKHMMSKSARRLRYNEKHRVIVRY